MYFESLCQDLQHPLQTGGQRDICPLTRVYIEARSCNLISEMHEHARIKPNTQGDVFMNFYVLGFMFFSFFFVV